MQGKDSLEKFIHENRMAFDDKKPNDHVWNKIDASLEPKQTNELWYWKAAVILLIGAVTFLLIDRPTDGLDKQIIDEHQALETSNLEKFEELELFYTSIISNKNEKLLVELEEGNEFDYLGTDIKDLDVIYDDLKEVFLESQQSEEVLDRLIHILRQKIHMLNSQLDILERERLPEDMKSELGLTT